jgi:hypothetical protein
MTGHTQQYSILVVDIESFSDHADPSQPELRRALYDVVRTAVEDVNLPWNEDLVRDEGDGLIMLVPADISPVRLPGDLIRALVEGLAEKATIYNEEHRLRLRVALHQGLVQRDGRGLSGQALIEACRLIDADLLRSVLAGARRSQLALIVSDRFFGSVIAPGHRSLDRASYLPVSVDLKKFPGYPAWVHVPGYAAPPGIPPRAHRTPSQGGEDPAGPTNPREPLAPAEVGGDATHGLAGGKPQRYAAKFNASVNNGPVTIHGDQVFGPKAEYHSGEPS